MPVRLETKNSWQEVIADALARRKGLEDRARDEQRQTGEYIRSIILLQAQAKSKDRDTLTVEVIEKALIDDFEIPEKEIAIATGDQREIEGVDLFSPDCPIRALNSIPILSPNCGMAVGWS